MFRTPFEISETIYSLPNFVNKPPSIDGIRRGRYQNSRIAAELSMDAGDSLALTEFDRSLITLLEADGRQSNTEIARKMNVGESTVRRRIDWLIKQGVVQITAQTDPLKIGYPVWVVAQIEVEVGLTEEVVEAVAKFPEVTFIAITTGSYDALFTAIFRNTGELYDFLGKSLSSIKGIRKIESSLVLRLVKRQFQTPTGVQGEKNSQS